MNRLITSLKIDSIIASSGAGLAYIFGVEYAAILPTILILMIADHITGIAKALNKNEPITSYGLRGFTSKMAIYAGALIGVYHLSTLASGEMAPIVGLIASLTPFYIGLTEFKSIVENSAEAGFNIPGVKKLDDILSQKK